MGRTDQCSQNGNGKYCSKEFCICEELVDINYVVFSDGF